MQYGSDGVLIARFSEVSNIRTVIEKEPGEDCIRYQDLHQFAQGTTVATRPKTVLYRDDVLSPVDAMNLWTRLHDREHQMGCRQFGIRHDPPPAIVESKNIWVDFDFRSSYADCLDVGEALGIDYVFVDVIWDTMESYRRGVHRMIPQADRSGSIIEKMHYMSMCCTMDWEVSKEYGGEPALKALCDEAARRGIGILSWLGISMAVTSALVHAWPPEAAPGCGPFASKESGRHPDGGYPTELAALNLHTPVYEYLLGRVLGVCERTGLSGFLLDSYSNLGWWHLDYARGDMAPQFDRMANIYASLANQGLYAMPEAIVAFSNHSMLHMQRPDMYDGDNLGYSYNTNIALPLRSDDPNGKHAEAEILRGRRPIDELFRCYAHKRVPVMGVHHVPKSDWNGDATTAMHDLFATYKAHRNAMCRRTVLDDDIGVVWEDSDGGAILFSFHDGPGISGLKDARTGDAAGSTRIEPNRVYAGPAEVLLR